MIKRILCSLGIGCVLTIFLMQYDPWVQHTCARLYMQAFEHSIGCSFTGTVRRVRLFPPMLEFERVCVGPYDTTTSSWSWQCARYCTGFSLAHFLRYGMLDMWVAIDGLEIHSSLSRGSLAIMEHVYALLKGPDFVIPLSLQSLSIHNGHVYIDDYESRLALMGQFSSNSRMIHDQFKSYIYVADGSMQLRERVMNEQWVGTIAVNAKNYMGKPGIKAHIEGRVQVPQLVTQPMVFINGVWRNDYGVFDIRSTDQTFNIQPLLIKVRDDAIRVHAAARIPLAYWWRLYTNDNTSLLSLYGSTTAYAKALLTSNNHDEYTMHITGTDIACSNVIRDVSGDMHVHMKNTVAHNTFSLQIPAYGTIQGAGFLDTNKKCGAVIMHNTSVGTTPYTPLWRVQPYAFNARILWDKNRTIGTYSYTGNNAVQKTALYAHGVVTKNDNQLQASGVLQDTAYTFLGTTTYPYLTHVTCTNKYGNCIINMQPLNNNAFEGIIDIAILRSLMQRVTGYDMQGQGTIRMSGTMNDAYIKTHMYLENGTIRLPQTYNFINGFDADVYYDWRTKQLVASNVCFSLYRGHARMPRVVLWFDDRCGIRFMHIPLLLDRCLFNMHHDLFAMVSGNLVLTRVLSGQLSCKGHLILDRAQLKENIFSHILQKKLVQYTGTLFNMGTTTSLPCTISLETKDPARVDTAFLQANAHINIMLTHNIFDPEVTGEIKVLSGNLKFPYKPLHITRGVITFVPNRRYNPFIDLIAKNTIRQCAIGLHVTGSLLDHQIMFESTPPLTEEQIIALLLIGSSNESLNTIAPALIAHNLKQVLFGEEQSTLLDKYFRPFTRAFNIHLIPSFTDQTGRGGLRGAIEIDVNDRLRAFIQKNFSLTEDTRFELEYLFSDDITVRGIRDERRDIGAEVEMRWKF